MNALILTSLIGVPLIRSAKIHFITDRMMTAKTLMFAILCCLFVNGLKAQKRTKFPREKDLAAYLMVYFKDDTHGLYMALSKDGYTFTDVNKGLPVIAGDTIAEQKGVRDPYIYRAPDGNFCLALTDLHIYAQKAGYRNTLWDRDEKQYGWGNNRGLVLMKSKDLLNWSHTVLRVDQAFPSLADIGCAWAPEMIYDRERGQTMLYFSMRFGKSKEKVYYTYMNDEFNKMLTEPKVLFEYPNGASYIDADITRVGSKYHMFYCSHDGTAGIKQAVSSSASSGYIYDPAWVDPEKGGCEAPTVFKRLGQNKWVLIYDIYSIKPHNFGFMETADFKNFSNLGHFNEGVMKTTNFTVPKHPNVIHLTRKEAQRLADAWHLDMKF